MVVYIGFFGIVRSEDEGIGAHLFQLWLVSEPFIIGYFAMRWLPRAPKQGLIILAAQILAAILPCIPVFYFSL